MERLVIDFNAISDEDLYQMCIQGDEDAWQYTYNYILIICRWSKWNLRDEPEDLAQRIILHLLEKAMKKVKQKKQFRSFVKTTAINKIKDSFKEKKPDFSIDEIKRDNCGDEYIQEYPDQKKLHDKILMDFEFAGIIDSAIKNLSPACQRIVSEYINYKLGIYKSYNELSKILKMPIPTISSSVRRCLDRLLEFKEIKEIKALGTQ
jgi:RNA polymerase sigma factor (sigma-70 family)